MAKVNRTKRLEKGGSAPDAYTSGNLDLESARNGITNDTTLSNGKKREYLHRLDNVTKNITDLGIGVQKGSDGTASAWRWNNGSNDASRFGGVTEQDRSGPFEGKGVLGLSGGGYDKLLDYMVVNGHVKFDKSEKPTTPPATEPPVETPKVVTPETPISSTPPVTDPPKPTINANPKGSKGKVNSKNVNTGTGTKVFKNPDNITNHQDPAQTTPAINTTGQQLKPAPVVSQGELENLINLFPGAALRYNKFNQIYKDDTSGKYYATNGPNTRKNPISAYDESYQEITANGLNPVHLDQSYANQNPNNWRLVHDKAKDGPVTIPLVDKTVDGNIRNLILSSERFKGNAGPGDTDIYKNANGNLIKYNPESGYTEYTPKGKVTLQSLPVGSQHVYSKNIQDADIRTAYNPYTKAKSYYQNMGGSWKEMSYKNGNVETSKNFFYTPDSAITDYSGMPFRSDHILLDGYQKHSIGGILSGIGKVFSDPTVQEGLKMGQTALQVATTPQQVQPVESVPDATGGVDVNSIANIVAGILKKKPVMAGITPMNPIPSANIPTVSTNQQLAPMMAKKGAKLVTRKIVKGQVGLKTPKNPFLEAAQYGINLALGMHPEGKPVPAPVKPVTLLDNPDFQNLVKTATAPTPWKPIVVNPNEPGLGLNVPALTPLAPKPEYQVGNPQKTYKDMPGVAPMVDITPGGKNLTGKGLPGGKNMIGDQGATSGIVDTAKSILNNVNVGDVISSVFSKPKGVVIPNRPLLQQTQLPVTPITGLSYQDENRMKNTVAETRALVPRSSDIASSIVTGRANAAVAANVVKGVADANAQAIGVSTQAHRQDTLNNIQQKAQVDAQNGDITFQNLAQAAQGKLNGELAKQKWLGDTFMRLYNRNVTNSEKGAYLTKELNDFDYGNKVQDARTNNIQLQDMNTKNEANGNALWNAFVHNNPNLTAEQATTAFLKSAEAVTYLKNKKAIEDAIVKNRSNQTQAASDYSTNTLNSLRKGINNGSIGSMFFKKGGLVPRFKSGGSTNTATTEAKVAALQAKQEAASRRAEQKLTGETMRQNADESQVRYLQTKRITDANAAFFQQLVPRRSK